MANDILEISNCPLCKRKHRYSLRVERSKYLLGRSLTVVKKKRRIKRIFNCPNKNEFFEAIIELEEDERGQVSRVEVDGIIEGGNHAKSK